MNCIKNDRYTEAQKEFLTTSDCPFKLILDRLSFDLYSFQLLDFEMLLCQSRSVLLIFKLVIISLLIKEEVEDIAKWGLHDGPK